MAYIGKPTLVSTQITPTGDVTATDLQGAIAELASEKATFASPTLTGVPTAPTATAGTNTTQVATTAGVRTEIPNMLNASGTAPMYACRAWANFNGTGTVAIRASGNVSSITDNGVGNYTVNFTTAMSDANYSTAAITSNSLNLCSVDIVSSLSTSVQIGTTTESNGARQLEDKSTVNVVVFR